MNMNVTETVNQACGHWPRILPELGVKVIKNRHKACPVCGGSDRFRFDDKEGRGTWFCNQCGAGDGLKLVEKVFGVKPADVNRPVLVPGIFGDPGQMIVLPIFLRRHIVQ